MLFIYLVVLVIAIYAVVKLLGPELAKPVPAKPAATRKIIKYDQVIEPVDKRIEKLEILLIEKNNKIQAMQTELKAYHAQAHDFDKVKTVLGGEILRLREQNRIFRSELGLPAAQMDKMTST